MADELFVVVVAIPIIGRIISPARLSQKNPNEVKASVPKVFPFFHSMIPAIT